MMKSPFTGGEVIQKTELEEFEYRKVKVTIEYQYCQCVDTGEGFTTMAMEEENMARVHEAYRIKCGIPSTAQIIALRNKYGLSASVFAKILGFGANQYRKYEAGEIPNISNGRMIALIDDARSYERVLQLAKNLLSTKEYENAMCKLRKYIEKESTKKYKLEFTLKMPTQKNRSLNIQSYPTSSREYAPVISFHLNNTVNFSQKIV